MRPQLVLPLVVAVAGTLAFPAAAADARRPAAAPARLSPAEQPAPEALLRLADRLRRLEEDGLDPAAYPIPPAALAAADPEGYRGALLAAAATALTDLLHGRARDIANRPDIRRDPAAVPLTLWLAELAAAPEPARVIDRAALLPPGAAALKAELARLRARAAAGGLPTVPAFASPGETLEPGAIDPVRVPALRARLGAAAGPPPADPLLYDPPLVEAVKRFQAAEGLEADGRIGRLTMAALNRPVEVQIRQLRVALDMRRGLAPPPSATERRIEVNIPDHRLLLLEGERVALDMAVIVGRPTRPTPVMRARLTAVQFNPPWGVPERNAREDLLPRFRRDPVAMREKGFRLYAWRDGERVEIDPTTVNWTAVNPQRFPYVVRQDAGDANALGRIKFVMPNGEDIFMHDTPDRTLFRRPDRAFSSGCIRLERPMDLLDAALQGTAGWDRARVDRVLDGRQTSGVALGRTIPVRLHYTTVTVEAGSAVRIRPDIYGLDQAYARAMDAPPRPSRVATAPGGEGGGGGAQAPQGMR